MDRAQAFTLEGTAAAIIIVTAVLFGLQAIDTGPWAGTPDRQPDRLATEANDLLAVAHERGALGEAVRCYGTGKPVIDGGVNNESNSDFERMLADAFDEQGRTYELYASYWNTSSGREEVLLSGTDARTMSVPDSGAGVASRRFALYDDMPIQFNRGCSRAGPPLDRASRFYVPDVNETSNLYNVVEVRLIVW